MREFARITHSVSGYAGLGLYSNLTQADIDTMWEKLAAGVAGMVNTADLLPLSFN